MATNSELAQQVLDLIHELVRGGRVPANPHDPVLDNVAALIAHGLQREGFASELIRQAGAEGIELNARQICEVLIASLQGRSH